MLTHWLNVSSAEIKLMLFVDSFINIARPLKKKLFQLKLWCDVHNRFAIPRNLFMSQARTFSLRQLTRREKFSFTFRSRRSTSHSKLKNLTSRLLLNVELVWVCCCVFLFLSIPNERIAFGIYIQCASQAHIPKNSFLLYKHTFRSRLGCGWIQMQILLSLPQKVLRKKRLCDVKS